MHSRPCPTQLPLYLLSHSSTTRLPEPDRSCRRHRPRSAAALIRDGHVVLSHCGMGFNRSALVAGLILIELGMPGPRRGARLRERQARRALQRDLRRLSRVDRPDRAAMMERVRSRVRNPLRTECPFKDVARPRARRERLGHYRLRSAQRPALGPWRPPHHDRAGLPSSPASRSAVCAIADTSSTRAVERGLVRSSTGLLNPLSFRTNWTRRRADLFVGGRRIEVEERFDVAAHGSYRVIFFMS